MRYYSARQRRDDSRWDYTVLIDGLVFPVGYCAGLPDMDSPTIMAEFGGERSALYLEYKMQIEKNREHYHATGHGSRAEARQCYKRYLLDTDMKLDLSIHNAQHRCMVCGTWTQGMAVVAHKFFILCDEHRKRVEIENLMNGIDDHWEP